MRTVALVLVYAAVAGAGTFVAFRPAFETGFALATGDRGDGMLNHYILEHSWRALADPGYPGTFFSPPCFAPQRYTVYYSENLWGTAPVYWALRLGLPDAAAYQWWQVLVNLPNFVAFAVAARWLKVPHALALLGAFLWAFGSVHVEFLKHQQMIPRFWMPLAVYHAVALAGAPSVRAAALLLLWVFLQCLACVYTGWFLAVGLLVFVPALVALTPGARGRLRALVVERRGPLALVLVAWLGAMAALFGPYVVANAGRVRGYEECLGMLPTVSAWFTAPPGAPWHEALAPHLATVTGECYLFSGFGLYALALVAAVHTAARGRRLGPAGPVAAAGLLAAGAWVLLTLAVTPDGGSAWYAVRLLPGGQAMRAVSRVYTIVYLFATLGALVWLGAAAGRLRPLARGALFAALGAAIAAEQLGVRPLALPKDDFYRDAERLAAAARGAPLVWFVPGGDETGPRRWPYDDVLAMWAGLRANVPVANGYSGRGPDGYPPDRAPTEPELVDWLRGRYRGPLRVIDVDAPDRPRTVTIE